jgi:drug/metabolite transporter (DMT)-like permease
MAFCTATCAKKTHFLSGMLVFGTMTAITMKMQLEMMCVGFGKVEHTFDKPFFQSIAMFVAMLVALPLQWVLNCVNRKRTETKKGTENEALLSGEEQPVSIQDIPSAATEEQKKPEPKKPTHPIVIAIPSLCDLIASTIMTFGLIYISVSVFQMLRGSMVIFSAILTRIFLPGRRVASYQLVGIGMCFVALCMVGAAGIMEPQPNRNVSVTQNLIGIALVVGSQLIQAGQLVIEEFLLKDLSMPPLAIVGYEGLWGTVMMVVLACPLAYLIPGSDFSTMKHNSLENTWDSFLCLYHNPILLAVVLLFCFAVLFYNCYGMLITDSFSAVNRTIFEACRTACIWITNLIIHAIWRDSPYGEIWSRWSWLQLAGFVILISSSFVYNAIIKIPGLEYKKKDQKKEAEEKKEEKPTEANDDK